MSRDCIAAIPKPRKRRTESGTGPDTAGAFDVEPAAAGAVRETAKATPKRQSAFNPIATTTDSLLSRNDIRHTGSNSFVVLFKQGLKLDIFPSVRGATALTLHALLT